MKLGKLFAVALAASLLLTGVSSVKALDWGYFEDRKVSMEGKSLVGLVVVKETLHASGYTYETWGEVTDVWLTTDRCYILNEITDEKTWTAKHPCGEYAKGSFKAKIGVPTPWGTVGTSGSTHTLSILF